MQSELSNQKYQSVPIRDDRSRNESEKTTSPVEFGKYDLYSLLKCHDKNFLVVRNCGYWVISKSRLIRLDDNKLIVNESFWTLKSNGGLKYAMNSGHTFDVCIRFTVDRTHLVIGIYELTSNMSAGFTANECFWVDKAWLKQK